MLYWLRVRCNRFLCFFWCFRWGRVAARFSPRTEDATPKREMSLPSDRLRCVTVRWENSKLSEVLLTRRSEGLLLEVGGAWGRLLLFTKSRQFGALGRRVIIASRCCGSSCSKLALGKCELHMAIYHSHQQREPLSSMGGEICKRGDRYK